MNEQAKGELAPGGLAMVYGLVHDTELNGCTVTLMGRVEDLWPEHKWNAEHERDDWAVEGLAVIFHARNLMPIQPEADPLHTERDLCLNA